jgi:predicted PurR-regulated permease PerM
MAGESVPGWLRDSAAVAWRTLAVVTAVGVLVYASVQLAVVVVPLILAVLVLPILRPLHAWISRFVPDTLAAFLVVVGVIAVGVLFFFFLISVVVANWNEFWLLVQVAFAEIVDWFGRSEFALSPEQQSTLQEALKDTAVAVTSLLLGGFSTVGSFVFGTFIFLAVVLFGVRDWNRFLGWLMGPKEGVRRERIEEFAGRYDIVMRRYWQGTALVGVFDGVVVAVGLAIIGVPGAFALGVFTFFASFIPYLGPVLAGALAALVALASEGGTEALWTLLLFLFVFNTGENLMRPKIYGDTVKLHPLVNLLAITVGVLLAGALGAILAIPIVALVREAKRTAHRITPGS